MKLKRTVILLLAATILGIVLFVGSVNAPTQPNSNLTNTQEAKNQLIVEALARVGENNVYLVDVRTKQEWNAGHVSGAMLWGLEEKLNQGELPNIPKDATIYLYCRSGRRAEIAKGILEQAGFKNVINLGGLEDLVNAGAKLEL